MSDTSGTPLVPSRDSRLTPDDVAQRAFTQAKRGYAESEVRAYLRLVADELAATASRERELAGRVQSLEERLSTPSPMPSDQDLIAALGEETARVLGQARESAIELRTKAEEHARRLVKEAQDNARQLRTQTQQTAETKAREVEDAARGRANDIVSEARTMRDRVLSDLAERRQELERQVSELRAGRGKLVETYQVVERALSQATRVLADDPAGATRATPPVAPTPEAAPPAAPDQGAGASEPATADGTDADADTDTDASPAAATETAASPAAPASGDDAPAGGASDGRDVGALFDRLRSEQGVTTAEDAPPPASRPAAEAAAAAAPESAEPTSAPEPESEPPAGTVQPALAARDEALAPASEDLARRARRAVQDEQNDVLDGLRRQRGKIDTAKILPAADEQLARWAHVLQPAVDQAYEAGAASTGAPVPKRGASVPASLLTELAAIAVTPLRSRLEASLTSIDARSPADLEIAAAQTLGARYREWRTQDLDEALGDALAVAYSRGVYDAAPEGARLRWVAAREGKCPDCDDNALEPTVKGGAFPTGQTAPPAHPGCRCLLVVDAEA